MVGSFHDITEYIRLMCNIKIIESQLRYPLYSIAAVLSTPKKWVI